MHGAHRHLRAALAVDEAGVTRHASSLLQGMLARAVPLEQLGNDGRDGGVRSDDLLAVRSGHVAISEWRNRWPNALLGLLLHALARFLGQVVDVVLCHQYLDAVH